jgi:hypothetical protein
VPIKGAVQGVATMVANTRKNKKHAGQEGDKPGGLQLKAPANGSAGAFHRNQNSCNSEKAADHTGTVYGAVTGGGAGGALGKTQYLEAQHGKDAGHEVENGAASQRENQHQPDRGRCFGRAISAASGSLPGDFVNRLDRG